MELLQLVWVHWKELRQELWADRLGCSQAQQSEQLVQLGLHLLRFETGNRQNNKTTSWMPKHSTVETRAFDLFDRDSTQHLTKENETPVP